MSIEDIVDLTTKATYAHLKDAGYLRASPVVGTDVPAEPAASVPSLKDIDPSTPEGAKAFDAFVAENGKEILTIKS